MTTSRRQFIKAVGASGVAVAGAPLFTARGSEAIAGMRSARPIAPGAVHPLELAARTRLQAQSAIPLDSNENPNGASRGALDAVRGALSKAPQYPYEFVEDLRFAIADLHNVGAENVLIGSGSSEILRMALYAFASPDRHLVTAAPTYEDPAYYAQLMGADVTAVQVDGSLKLDLTRMAAASRRAGLVFVCNPNNPTGTIHGEAAIADFVRTVRQNSRDTVVMIDEAYHEYVEDPSHKTAIPLAAGNPNVIVARTFSKVFGMAGLRVGYAIANPNLIATMASHRLVHGVNLLGAVAAKACAPDAVHIANERRLNSAAREFIRSWFNNAGFVTVPSHANYIMANIRRDSLDFQYRCAELGVLVGRPFPPLNSHARISIGTMDEMRKASEVFRRVLGRG
jgi:histidinol-phosphate aminotransferase